MKMGKSAAKYGRVGISVSARLPKESFHCKELTFLPKLLKILCNEKGYPLCFCVRKALTSSKAIYLNISS